MRQSLFVQGDSRNQLDQKRWEFIYVYSRTIESFTNLFFEPKFQNFQNIKDPDISKISESLTVKASQHRW